MKALGPLIASAEELLKDNTQQDLRDALQVVEAMRKRPGENREQFRKRLKQLRRKAGKVKAHGNR